MTRADKDESRAEDHLGLMAAAEPCPSHFVARLRNYLVTGLVVVGPAAITVYVVWWFIQSVDAWVTPLLPQAYLPETYLGFKVPGIGLIAGVVGLILVGAVTANLLSRVLGTYAEIALDRTPVVRTLYRLFKQIFVAAFAGNRVAFQQMGVIEFPRRGLFAPVLILVV